MRDVSAWMGAFPALSAPLCYAKLPRTGLGNMLLVWARAAVFAELNQMPLLTSGFAALRLGPFLRFEREKRIYVTDFLPPSPVQFSRAELLLRLGRVVREAPIERIPVSEMHPFSLYLYHAPPDFFLSFAEHRDFVRERLLAMLTPERRRELSQAEAPVIGVHVRRGDFGKISPDHDLARSLGPTPLSHFIRIIRLVREFVQKDLEVTVFSDGHDDELRALLDMPNVRRAKSRSAIVDLILLSRSQIVIPSAWSTFSLWSGFLSDAPLLLHPMEHEHLRAIRPAGLSARFYEGCVPERVVDFPALLQRNLRCLKEATE